MLRWYLNQLDKHSRRLVIPDRDGVDPYLERFYILWPDSNARERKDIPFNTMLHHFLQSDADVWHSHPWDYYHTFILKGGYWVHTPWGTKWCGPGHHQRVDCHQLRHVEDDPDAPLVPANLHWVEIPKPGVTWTLFTRGRTVREWGFYPDLSTGVEIPWQQYLNDYRAQQRIDSTAVIHS